MTDVLITAAELRTALAGDAPPVVLDARYLGPAATGTGLPAYLAGHIPGSQWIDVDADLAGPVTGPGGRHPLPEPARFQTAMRRAGVRDDVGVVVLDGDNSLAASRAWWLLTDAGHRAVRVLDGGFAAWQRAGGEVATGDPGPVAEGDFTARPGSLPVVDAAEVAVLLGPGTGVRVWDVRTPERFRGESEPIDPVAGHIPGAHNLPAPGQHLPDGRFRPRAQLRERFAAIRPGDVVYCGSGITAAQTLLAMTVAGVAAGVRLYAGSWSDWIADPARPVARG